MIEKLRLGFAAWQESQKPTTTPVEIPVAPVQEKSIIQILLDAVIEVGIETYKDVWEKTSPGSYSINRAIYAVAPHSRPEDGGLLNAGALITWGYGFKQIVDNANRRN